MNADPMVPGPGCAFQKGKGADYDSQSMLACAAVVAGLVVTVENNPAQTQRTTESALIDVENRWGVALVKGDTVTLSSILKCSHGKTRVHVPSPVVFKVAAPPWWRQLEIRASGLINSGFAIIPPAGYSSASGCRPMFFSPAAFLSLWAFTQSSQCLPAARSLPLNSSRATSA